MSTEIISETSNTKQKRKLNLSAILIFLLIISQVWTIYRLTNVENQLTATQEGITDTIDTLEYVQALAENADQYAHTHDSFSDFRLKTNISGIPNALDNVMALQGVMFDWNTSKYPELKLDSGSHIGFLAQDVEVIYPEIVSTDENGFKRIDYEKLVPVLVEAIKQQQIMIQELQEEITTIAGAEQQ